MIAIISWRPCAPQPDGHDAEVAERGRLVRAVDRVRRRLRAERPPEGAAARDRGRPRAPRRRDLSAGESAIAIAIYTLDRSLDGRGADHRHARRTPRDGAAAPLHEGVGLTQQRRDDRDHPPDDRRRHHRHGSALCPTDAAAGVRPASAGARRRARRRRRRGRWWRSGGSRYRHRAGRRHGRRARRRGHRGG